MLTLVSELSLRHKFTRRMSGLRLARICHGVRETHLTQNLEERHVTTLKKMQAAYQVSNEAI